MPSPAVFEREPAYLLHRRPYQDKAYLVYFLTLSHGWISALARFSSRLSDNSLQAFVPVFLSCGGQGELLNVRSIEARGVAALNHPEAQVYGLYINELILRLLPPHYVISRLFNCYVKTLMQLGEPHRQELSVRRFEMEVLKTIGQGLAFLGHRYKIKIDHRSCYRCEPDAMPMPVRTAATAATSDRNKHYHGRTLLAMQEGLPDDTEAEVLLEAKRMLENAINYCLGAKRLRSRNLLGYLSKQRSELLSVEKH